MSYLCTNKCRIGIMGGSFDPIHYGHLNLAEQIRRQFELDSIYFIPVGSAPHKDDKQMSSKFARYEMTLVATLDNPNFKVSRIEIDSEQKSYTIHTVKRMKEMLKTEDELFFITGADAIIELEEWKNFKALLKQVTFIAATRPGVTDKELNQKIQGLIDTYDARILLTEVPALAISSTDIRKRVQAGESIKYLLPETVEQYIYKNKLYME